MPDYNIYIHIAESTSQQSPTKPWNAEDRESPTASWQDRFVQGINVAENPDMLVSKGVSAVSKAVPAVAVAMLIVKFMDKVATTAIEGYTTETGDYRANYAYNNFKASVGVVFRPFGTVINEFKAQRQFAINDEKRRLTRELLGDSIINSTTNRGV